MHTMKYALALAVGLTFAFSGCCTAAKKKACAPAGMTCCAKMPAKDCSTTTCCAVKNN